MISERVCVGIIGLGYNGLEWLKAYQRHPNAEVRAVSDLNAERAHRVAAEFAVPGIHYGLDIVERTDIDLVSIHTPDHLHVEPFVRAFQAGKHIVVEKPLANEMEDLHRMVAASRQAPGQKVLVGHVLRFMPYFVQVKRIIERGELGTIHYAEGDYIHDLRYQGNPTHFNPDLGVNWYLQHEKPMVGGGAHPLDLLRWFLGEEIIEVQAMSHRIVFTEMVHDASIVALYRFQSGAVAKVTALYAVESPYAEANHLALYGTKGTIRGSKICRKEAEGFIPLPVPPGTDHPYDGEVEHILDCIRNDKPTLVDAIEGAKSAAPVILAEEAAQRKCAIPVPTF